LRSINGKNAGTALPEIQQNGGPRTFISMTQKMRSLKKATLAKAVKSCWTARLR
jgi:hypothetical protein